MRKNSLHIFIALLCLLQVLSFMKISNLQSSLQGTKNNLSSSISNVSSEVENIYTNVDERLKHQASIIEAMDYELGKANQNNLTVPVTFTLIPKEITKSSIATLDVDGKSVIMKRNGTTFTAVIPVSIFNQSAPKVTIKDGDILKNEQLDDFSVGNIKERMLPILYTDLDGWSSYGSGEYERNGTLNIELKQADSDVTFSAVRFVIDVDNKVIFNKKISPKGEWDSFEYKIDQKIPLEDGQICTMTVIAIDTLGLEHHYIVDCWEQSNSNNTPEPYFHGEEIIYNSDKELLYKPEHIELN